MGHRDPEGLPEGGTAQAAGGLLEGVARDWAVNGAVFFSLVVVVAGLFAGGTANVVIGLVIGITGVGLPWVVALMLTMPYSVLLVFTFNILLTELGASDFSGTGAAIGNVSQIGPIVTVLVVSGAGATAMCADLGARTIRDELDALRVMGVNPIQALVVPRVLARPRWPWRCRRSVILVGLAGAFFFVVYHPTCLRRVHSSPGLTLLTGIADVLVSLGQGGVVRDGCGPDRLL